jgi:hypothetical protein
VGVSEPKEYHSKSRSELVYLLERWKLLKGQAEQQCTRAQKDREATRHRLKRAERALRDCGGLGAGQAIPPCGHENLRDDCVPCLVENVRRCSYWEDEAKNKAISTDAALRQLVADLEEALGVRISWAGTRNAIRTALRKLPREYRPKEENDNDPT